MSKTYKYISNKFLWKGHFYKATNEYCRCGEEFVVLRRTGYETELENLPPNHGIHPKICVLKAKVRDKLL